MIHPDWNMTIEEYLAAARDAGLDAHAAYDSEHDDGCVGGGPDGCIFADVILHSHAISRSRA